jgi:hypothetical protein
MNTVEIAYEINCHFTEFSRNIWLRINLQFSGDWCSNSQVCPPKMCFKMRVFKRIIRPDAAFMCFETK